MYKAKCRDRYWQQRDHILQRSKVHKATGRGKAMQAKNNFKRHSANARRVLEETAADTRTDVERINSLIEALPKSTLFRCPWKWQDERRCSKTFGYPNAIINRFQ